MNVDSLVTSSVRRNKNGLWLRRFSLNVDTRCPEKIMECRAPRNSRETSRKSRFVTGNLNELGLTEFPPTKRVWLSRYYCAISLIGDSSFVIELAPSCRGGHGGGGWEGMIDNY